ncbi:hydrophobin [Ganoderma leucocontextum]|nr:hydrophobin [Ganoderma leucocontextum]
MFARAAAFSLLALPLFAVATPTVLRRDSCNTGDIQCCNSVEDSNSTAISTLFSLLGINAQDITGQVGLQCSPLTVIGAGVGSSCSQAPVCCQNNNVGGLVSIGCVPIQL